MKGATIASMAVTQNEAGTTPTARAVADLQLEEKPLYEFRDRAPDFYKGTCALTTIS